MVTHNMLRMHEGKEVFLKKKNIRFVTAIELIKSLIQVKSQRLLLTCMNYHLILVPGFLESISEFNLIFLELVPQTLGSKD